MRNVLLLAMFLIFAQSAAAAKMSLLIVKTDTQCELSINGKAQGVLKVESAKSLLQAQGKQIIICTSNGKRVERTEILKAGASMTVQLELRVEERFEQVAEGINDNAQKIIWTKSDNGSNIGWEGAKKYCADLGQGWKLASGENLLSLYDASGKSELTLDFNGTPYVLKPATTLIKFTGGGYWSDEVNEYGVWGVNLATGTRYTFTFDAVNFTRALCVRPN